jgi:hypothetical protein
MWKEFFPNAVIHGIDINSVCAQFVGSRRKIYIGDQFNENFLMEVLEKAGGTFDIIIDDGSHIAEHQIFTFSFLFSRMSDHGIYVIEDTGGCVGDYELRTINYLKQRIDNIMFWPESLNPKNWKSLSEFPVEATWEDRNIVGIAFYRWAVFIMRGHNPSDNPYLEATLKIDSKFQ